MTSSWKIGAISGLIAGFVFTIIADIFIRIGLSMGLWESWYRPFLENNTLVSLPIFCFWSVVLGVIYSKVHSLIPGKGVLKGLIYGLFLYLIVTIRIEMYVIPYGSVLNPAGDLLWGFFVWTAYGLSLGILYKFLHNKYYPPSEEPKIITYDMKGGLLPGAIAGLFCGIAAGIVSVIGHLTGQWGVITGGELVPTIDFWISQFGTHTLITMIWGTIYGLIYPKVYNLVPGKKVVKGICYGLILFFITSGQIWTWLLVWYANHNAWQLFLVTALNYVWVFAHIVFGIVLGYLYKKPSE